MLIHRNVIKSLIPAVDPIATPQYAGIYVDPESQECIATNGHLLVRAAAPTLDDSPTIPVTGLLDAGALHALAKLTPKRVELPIDAHVTVASPIEMSANGTSKIAKDLQDATFPDWRAVIKVPSDAQTFTLSAKYLASLVAIAKAQGGRAPHVTFHVVPDQQRHAVYFDVGAPVDSPKVDGMLMPLRVD